MPPKSVPFCHIHKRPRHPHTHTPHTPHTHRHTHTHKCFDPLVTWDVCLGNALRSIPPVIPPFNTSRSIPPFNTLLNRRLPHIHRWPGVLTHTHMTISINVSCHECRYFFTGCVSLLGSTFPPQLARSRAQVGHALSPTDSDWGELWVQKCHGPGMVQNTLW